MSITPLLKTLWLADDIELDADGNVTIYRIFDEIVIEDPSRLYDKPAVLFCALRSMHGPISLTFQYTDMTDGSILIEEHRTVTRFSPLATLDVVMRVGRLPIPRSGPYLWEILCENEVLGDCRITAIIN
jgi:hypothetical protein